jgi:arachidonate 15-lipoxygenase
MSPILWKTRKTVWDGLGILKFRGAKPAVIPIPRDDPKKLSGVPFVSQLPNIPISNILVADRVPDDEASFLKRKAYDLQVGLYGTFGPMQDDLPPIEADPQKALNEAYTNAHRRLYPAPILPPELRDAPDLGFLAVAGAFSRYVERAPEGGYHWDFRDLGDYEHHPGLRSLGVRVRFEVDAAARVLRATHIESELGVSTPGDATWALASRLALCAASTHLSLVRHFNWIHLALGSAFAIATRNALPASHPLRRLLWPHVFGTQQSNSMTAKGQMSPGGEFECIWSFTHRGMCELFARTWPAFSIVVMDPERDAIRRGVLDSGFDTPGLDNLRPLFDVMHRHALRYLAAYYPSDEALRDDAAARAWLEDLERLTPNGLAVVAGHDVTLAGTARLIAACIYLATVEHDALGTSLWNYQLWVHRIPARVYVDGRREPLDVYQRLVNANFNLNVNRTQLSSDFSYLALDDAGRECFRTFRRELQALQTRMEQDPHDAWKIYPNVLEAHING